MSLWCYYKDKKFDEDNFHDALLLGRLNAGLSQLKLSAELEKKGVNLSQKTISKIERGEAWKGALDVNQKVILSVIADVLKLDYSKLLIKDDGRQMDLMPLPSQKVDALNLIDKVVLKVKYFMNYVKYFTH